MPGKEVEERPGHPARYSGVNEYLIILVEEAVFREEYYHPLVSCVKLFA